MDIATAHTPTQAQALIEMLGRMLPEERIWRCDHCGMDIAKKGLIDLSQMALWCKQCYKSVIE